jgi:hypothetical protein
MGQLENVPDSTVLPKCDVLARVAVIEKKHSNNGKLMYKAEYRIDDDGAGGHKNLPIWEQYLIGSEKDPEAEITKTWIEAPGARNLKRLFKKLGLDTTKDVDVLIVEAEGQQIGLSIIRFVEPDKKKQRGADGVMREVDNEYAGQPRNRISNYWTPGEKTPQIFEEEDSGEAIETVAATKATTSAKAPAQAATKAATTAKAAPKHSAVAEEEETAAPSTAAKAASKANGAAVEEETAATSVSAATAEDDDAAEAAKIAADAKAAKAKKAAAEKEAAEAKAPKVKMLPCPECQQPFPKSELGAHVADVH